MGFYTDSGEFTNLASLLSDQNSATVSMAVFGCGYEERIPPHIISTGSVLKQLDDILAFIDRYNPTDIKITGLVRTDTRHYPETAVEEAVKNALIHRDYSIEGPLLIAFVGRKLKVTSMGGLPAPLGTDDLSSGISVPRNPGLQRVFRRLHLSESMGTGIQRILACYTGSILQPRIECSPNVFRITLPPANVNATDPDIRTALLHLARNGPSSRVDIQKSIGAGRSKTTEILNRLISLGVVEVIGKGRSTRYVMR